jgi:hypothetical protein
LRLRKAARPSSSASLNQGGGMTNQEPFWAYMIALISIFSGAPYGTSAAWLSQ